MTLHDAIEKILKESVQPMTKQQIADELNETNWYQKKDGSIITAFQIHGRIRKYSHIFRFSGGLVSLEVVKVMAQKPPVSEYLEIKQSKIKNSADFRKRSFDPISDRETTTLVLGTLPGEKSLKLGEYYAHSGNRFWKILAKISGNDLPENYDQKIQLLMKIKVGVWDVVHHATRIGSLDVNIENEKPNDIDNFISTHKNLKIIAFNGSRCEALYDKYFTRHPAVKYISLPSTSPANTRFDFNTICKAWTHIIN